MFPNNIEVTILYEQIKYAKKMHLKNITICLTIGRLARHPKSGSGRLARRFHTILHQYAPTEYKGSGSTSVPIFNRSPA